MIRIIKYMWSQASFRSVSQSAVFAGHQETKLEFHNIMTVPVLLYECKLLSKINKIECKIKTSEIAC